MEILIANKAVIIGFFLATSELLSLIPSIKANGNIQLIIAAIKKLSGK